MRSRRGISNVLLWAALTVILILVALFLIARLGYDPFEQLRQLFTPAAASEIAG